MDINLILRSLTNAMKFFSESLKKMGIPDSPKNWVIDTFPITTSLVFYYRMPTSVKEFKLTKTFDSITATLKTVSTEPKEQYLMFFLDIKSSDADLLFKNILDIPKFKQDLQQVLLKDKKISKETYKALRNQNYMPYIDKLSRTLVEWLQGSNYKKAVKYGAIFDKLSKYIPDNYRVSPTLTLYRAILIDPKLLEKLKAGKPLVLKNRKYSSWTTDPNAALQFASGEMTVDKIAVILRKTFSKDDILLNVEKFGLFLFNRGKILFSNPFLNVLKKEKEIIVKNVKNDFKFYPKDVWMYTEWIDISPSRQKFKWKKL